MKKKQKCDSTCFSKLKKNKMESILDSGGKWRTVLFCCLLYVSTNSQDIQVLGSGVSTLKKSDMVVVFFVTVKNFGKKPRRTMLTCIECCEKVTEEDKDCDLMDLFGGDFGTIQPSDVKNLTLIYPNWYGYNRRGYCLVKVLHRDLDELDVSEINHRIDFDTKLTPDVFLFSLKRFWDPKEIDTCETPDLDPLDDCRPVNCMMKYSGNRNYFNKRIKMCQKVPVCLSDPKKGLPDIVYIPNSNICSDLENGITKDDIQQLITGQSNENQDQMMNIRCHHGEIDPKTGLCICHYGWKSEPFAPNTKSRQRFYSMCTIKSVPNNPYEYLPLWVGLIMAIWFVFFVTLCVWYDSFTTTTKSKSARKLYCLVEEDGECSESKSATEFASLSNAVLEPLPASNSTVPKTSLKI